MSIKPSHLDLWVGDKMIEEFMGIEKPFFNIFFFLKKNLKTTSWVTNIAIYPNTGLILYQISKEFFFKFYLLYINNLSVYLFLLAIIGRLLDCLETKIFKIMATLGVNIAHIAIVRQARKTIEPDPVQFAFLAELGGADSITVHLREDRRHIQDRDVFLLKKTIKTKLNLEMAATEEMLEIAKKTLPDYVTLVPEKREEVTTEGGLDLKSNVQYLKNFVGNLKDSNIEVSAFIDPLGEQINYSKEIGFDFIELHTGKYAELSGSEQYKELQRIIESTHLANDLGLVVNAGHGLNYNNVKKIASINNMNELNIGHSIVARALAIGLEKSVREMKSLITSN